MHGEVGCPCGERQAMAEGGVLGLPRDYLAMLASPDEAVAATADFSECIMCTKRAMGMCNCVGAAMRFCEEHAGLHMNKCKMGIVPFKAAAAVVVTCPSDPGRFIDLD